MQKRLAEASELPDASAELVLVRSGVQALLLVLGRKRGERFLRRWVELLESEEVVLPIRPRREEPSVLLARKQALAWLRAVIPQMIAALPPE